MKLLYSLCAFDSLCQYKCSSSKSFGIDVTTRFGNLSRFETGTSHFATSMVLSWDAHLETHTHSPHRCSLGLHSPYSIHTPQNNRDRHWYQYRPIHVFITYMCRWHVTISKLTRRPADAPRHRYGILTRWTLYYSPNQVYDHCIWKKTVTWNLLDTWWNYDTHSRFL